MENAGSAANGHKRILIPRGGWGVKNGFLYHGRMRHEEGKRPQPLPGKTSLPRPLLEQSPQVGYKSPVAAIRGGSRLLFPFFCKTYGILHVKSRHHHHRRHHRHAACSLTGAAVPAVSGADLVRAIPGLGSVCDLEVREFDNLPSPAITPDHMFRLAVMVRQYLARDDVSGVVITHGTDSLEESAYFLDLSLEGHKPVCFTAAMRSGDELSPDGPRNILAAVRVAAARPARHMGSLVVMNEQIHAAREVTKTHAANVATFQSPWWGPLGVVDGDRVIFRRAQLGRQTFLPHSLCKKVDLIKLVTGSDAAYLDFAVSRGVDGIVVESFGRGNVPPHVIPGIARALEKGVIVVNATRTGGRVLDEYGYEGGMLQQHRMGVIMAGELSAAKARLKLLLILSQYGPDGRPDPAEVARYFEHSM